MNRSHLAWWIAASLLLFTIVYLLLGKASLSSMPEKPSFRPTKVDLWACETVSSAQAVYVDPNADDSWTGVCTNRSGLKVDLFWGFSAGHSQEKALRSPDEMLVRPADRVLSRQRIHFTSLGSTNATHTASFILSESLAGENLAVLFWYQMAGRTYADRYELRVASIVNRLLLNPIPTSVVRMSAVIEKGNLDQVLMDEQKLASAIYSQVFNAVSLPATQSTK